MKPFSILSFKRLPTIFVLNFKNKKAWIISRTFAPLLDLNLRLSAYYAIAKFRGNLRFVDITVSYRKDYEQWMLQQDYSKTTVGIYIRSLRTIFNEAAEIKLLKKKILSLWKTQVSSPTSGSVKKL